MTKAIFFDLFETLITERENDKSLEVGTPDSRSPAAILGISERTFEKEWAERRPGRLKGYFADYYSVLKDIGVSLQLHIDDELLRTLDQQRNSAKLQLYRRIEPGILTLLEAVKNRGIRIGLISNCSAEEVHGLADSALMRFIDEPLLSCEVRCTKPHEDIYQLACRKLNVSPSEAIFIGDGGADELNGALKVGIKAYRATWFINRCPTGDVFPQITDPMHVLDLLG